MGSTPPKPDTGCTGCERSCDDSAARRTSAGPSSDSRRGLTQLQGGRRGGRYCGELFVVVLHLHHSASALLLRRQRLPCVVRARGGAEVAQLHTNTHHAHEQ
jgi:hypothetical protein